MNKINDGGGLSQVAHQTPGLTIIKKEYIKERTVLCIKQGVQDQET